MPQSPILEIESIVKDLKKAIREARSFLHKLKFAPRTSRQKLNSLIICNAILDKANCAVQLIDTNCYDGVALIARTALLHYVDLRNNYLYEDYSDLLDYLRAQHWIKSFRAYEQTPESPYSRALIEQKGDDVTELSRMVKIQGQEIKEIKEKLNLRYLKGNKVATSEFSKFELANLLDVYHAYYRLLSKGAHGNLDVLADSMISNGTLHWPPAKAKPSVVEAHLVLDIVLESSTTLAKKYRKPLVKCKDLRKSYYRGLVPRGA